MADTDSDNAVTLAIIGGAEPGDDLVIDCLLSDNHNFESEVTEFPVESGGTISDNIRNKPLVVTMDCLISNTPIGQAAKFRDEGTIPANTAYAAMLKIRSARRPVTIRTSLNTYRDMALQSLSIPRESGRGDELRFTATFKQIETVVNKRDKRVAIVGLQSGGTKTATVAPFFDNSQQSVYIYLLDNTWYDVAIVGWRKGVIFPLAEDKSIGSDEDSTGKTFVGKPGVVQLLEGAPIDIGVSQWLKEPDSAHKAALVKPRIIKAQGGVPRNVLYKKAARSILMLVEGDFKILRVF